MPFPVFNKFSKSIDDLLDFEEDNCITITRKTASGLEIETQTIADNKNALAGKIKGVMKDKQVGALEATFETAGNFSSKAKLTKLADNVVVTAKHGVKAAAHSGSVTAAYTQDSFVVTGEVSLKEKEGSPAAALALDVVGGADGFVGGAQVKANVHPKQELTDFGFALSYTQGDTLGVVTTEKKCSAFNVFLLQSIAENTSLGVKASYSTKDSKPTATAAVSHGIDADIVVKASVDTVGKVQGQISHQLANPAMKFTLAGVFSNFSQKNFGADSVAVAIEFGN